MESIPNRRIEPDPTERWKSGGGDPYRRDTECERELPAFRDKPGTGFVSASSISLYGRRMKRISKSFCRIFSKNAYPFSIPCPLGISCSPQLSRIEPDPTERWKSGGGDPISKGYGMREGATCFPRQARNGLCLRFIHLPLREMDEAHIKKFLPAFFKKRVSLFPSPTSSVSATSPHSPLLSGSRLCHPYRGGGRRGSLRSRRLGGCFPGRR